MNNTKHNSRPSSWRGNQHRPYQSRPLVSLGEAFNVAEKAQRAAGVDVTDIITNHMAIIKEVQQKRHEEALCLI